MSREGRLARLGLLHLIDKPEELERALAEGIEEEERAVLAWEAEVEELERREDARIRALLEPLTLEELEQRATELKQTVTAAVRAHRTAFAEAHELRHVRAELERRRAEP